MTHLRIMGTEDEHGGQRAELCANEHDALDEDRRIHNPDTRLRLEATDSGAWINT